MLNAYLLAALLGGGPGNDPCACLPKDVDRNEVVSVTAPDASGKGGKVTVEQTLKEIKARCDRGRLVDATGREVRFHRMVGCWGNPPENYQEMLRRQETELADLRKRYRVIEISCEPTGEPDLTRQ